MYQIISPHIDDAFLSLGGMIREWVKGPEQIDITYVFSISDWTSPQAIAQLSYPTDKQKVTAIRKSEEMDINILLPYLYRLLDFPDASVRNHEPRGGFGELYEQVLQKLEKIIDRSARCFFPLGLGHPDHLLIRNIGLSLLRKQYNIWFYEDMPYMAYQEMLPDVLYEFIMGIGMEPSSTSIDLHKKIEILKNYRSQLCDAWLQSITNYAYSPADNTYYERIWHCCGNDPDLIQRLQIALERAEEQRSRRPVDIFSQNNNKYYNYE
jgi:hypothetical protein